MYFSEYTFSYTSLSTGKRHPSQSTDIAAMYDFPPTPYYNAQAIVEEAIGPKILNDPLQNPLHNCSATVQYRLILPSNDSDSPTWILQSMMTQRDTIDSHMAVPKPYGGDEIYVEWKANTDTDMGVAFITDRDDGTYALKFVRPPLLQYNYSATKRKQHDDDRYGQLIIYYEYTCGIGNIFAPHKDQYQRSGEVFTNFTTDTTIPRPYIHDFIPPNSDSLITADNPKIDLSKYHIVIAFGDSLIMQMVRQYLKYGFWSRNIIWNKNIRQCLANADDVQEILQKFHTWHGPQIINATKQSKRIAVLTGSASWDAWRGCVRYDLIDHQNAIRAFLENITSTYPNVDFYWKSPSAMFLHRYTTILDALNSKDKKLLKPRYINYGILRRLYIVQKELMKELRIPFLDLYDSYYLSGSFTVPDDCRHFDDALTRLQLSYYWPGLDINKWD
jgi:hypothetical protein